MECRASMITVENAMASTLMLQAIKLALEIIFQQLSRQKAAKVLKAATMNSTVHPAHALISLHVNWIRIV
jgi:hypothetical protein